MSFRSTVIPVAGLGTRFLPVTKAIAKELIPLVDRPLIQYAVEEAVAAGSRRMVFVSSPSKTGLMELFRQDADLEVALEQKGRDDLLATVRELTRLAHVDTVVQHEPLGVGHAILQAAKAVGNEPFAVTFPDDFIVAEVPVLEQLRAVHEEHGGVVLAVDRVPRERVGRYGIIDGEPAGPGLYRVRDLVEKPAPEEAPSELAVVGRYVLPGAIFGILEGTGAGVGGEIQITDAIRAALREMPCHAVEFSGTRYDCGSRTGFLEATLAVAAMDPELAPVLDAFLARRERRDPA